MVVRLFGGVVVGNALLLLVTHNLASNAAFSAAAFSASGPRGMGPYLALSSSLKVSERASSELLILDGKVPRKPDLHPASLLWLQELRLFRLY